MTRRPLLPLLLLLVVLAAAAAVTSASPAAHTSSDIARTTTTESTPKTKLTTARGTSEKKKTSVTTSSRDSTKIESVAEKPTTTATTRRPTAEPTTSKPRGRPTKRRMPVALRRPHPSPPKVTKATTEPTKRTTTSKSATKATTETAAKTTPTTAQPSVTERTKGGRSTTSAPGFTAEVIPAPVCAAIVNSSLKTRQFRRNYLLGFTSCRCQSSKKAACEVTTPYPTVRPGSASAVHALEQSGAVDSPDLLLANIWAMQQGCQSNANAGAICHFGLFEKRPYCDCSVNE